jgi:hypothetical protein
MAGGYGRDLAITVALQRRTLTLALGSWQRWNDARPGAADATMEQSAA